MLICFCLLKTLNFALFDTQILIHLPSARLDKCAGLCCLLSSTTTRQLPAEIGLNAHVFRGFAKLRNLKNARLFGSGWVRPHRPKIVLC